MKRTLFLKTLLFSAATVALCGMTACSGSDDNIIGDEQPGAVKTYQVSIPATMPDDATTRAVSFDGTTSNSTFKAGEKVYVYNASRYTMMLNAEGTAAGYLTPTNISADGKSCDLTGTLTGASIYDIDNLLLMYNLNDVYAGNDKNKLRQYSPFKYFWQDGTQTGVCDGATASLTGWRIDDGVLTIAGTAQFQPVQSMFRFNFKDAATDAALSVKSVYISSENNALVRFYYPMQSGDDRYAKGDVHMSNDQAMSDVYMALCIDEANSAGDELTFKVKDADGNKYGGTKAAPDGGFKNGKYYYNSTPTALTLTERRILPTITWTTPSTAPETIDDEMIEVEDEDADFTLSGTSEGVCFCLVKNGTVRLNGLTASYGADNDCFIEGNYDITLDISGANTIACKNNDMCILAPDNLKLQGNGTLTVTANDATRCGIQGNINYSLYTNDNATITALDVSEQLAADGYTVTRSARTDNGDGTYTWTYTVRPVPSFSVSSTKKALFAPGNLQATWDGTSWSWAFAAHQWDYIGDAGGNIHVNGDGTLSAPGTVDLFQWIGESTSITGSGALGTTYNATIHGITDTFIADSDIYGTNTYEGLKSDWGETISDGYSWRTLTEDEWTWVLGPYNSPNPGTNCRTSSTIGGVANARWAKAVVHNKKGLIIFPDELTWDATEMGTAPTNINKHRDDFTYSLTDAQWTALETAGCVFLPAAGRRYESAYGVYQYDDEGFYWSSSSEMILDDSNRKAAKYVWFEDEQVYPAYPFFRYWGCSVRLVRYIQ